MVTVSIKTQAYVDEKRRIMIDLPDDVEIGMVELDVVVRQVSDSAEQYEPGTRDWVRAKLRAAGLLAENVLSAEEEAAAEELSEEEEEELGRKMAGPRPVEDYINEDREERF
jgi:hypothetical protein